MARAKKAVEAGTPETEEETAVVETAVDVDVDDDIAIEGVDAADGDSGTPETEEETAVVGAGSYTLKKPLCRTEGSRVREHAVGDKIDVDSTQAAYYRKEGVI